MGENIKNLEKLEKEAFEADKGIKNHPEKISTGAVAVEKARDAYDWLKRPIFHLVFSYMIKQYLRQADHNLPYYITQTGEIIDYVADPPSLSFGVARMHPEYKNINGKSTWGVNGMEINDDGYVKVNPEVWFAELDDFTGWVGNEYGHMLIKEYTGESVGSHLTRAYEPLIQYALAAALIAVGEINKAKKALSVTQYTRK